MNLMKKNFSVENGANGKRINVVQSRGCAQFDLEQAFTAPA